MTFLLYLGKVMLCSGILLGYYWLFLRNKRFHHYNRFFLQVTLLVSVVLPFFRIPVLNKPQDAVNQAVYQTINVLTVNYGEEDGLGAGPSRMAQWFTLENAGYLLYAVGVLVLLCMLVKSLLYIRRISKKYSFERISGLKFFTTREPGTPFSFFRSIFWSHELPFNSHDGQQIFRHELFHVQQKHSTDIILTELVTALFWFNPFFHLLKRELKAIHEFLADQYAISNNDRYAYAELLVMQTLKANHIPITNHFFQNHIKRRITMITNKQSTRYSYGSRLMALPVLALLFCSIALYAQRTTTASGKPVTGDSKPITVIIDAGHGGTDPGAVSKDGTVKEKNLALQISQKIQQLSSAYNVNVVMTRTDDNLPGGGPTIHDGLRARTAIAEKVKPDMYISIHISLSDKEGPFSGFEVWVSNKDNERSNRSKELGAALTNELSKIYTTEKTLKQRTTNIWVLEQTPCPAVLIECGYIDNEKDLAFVSNSSNQEAIAKKILEGIVNAKNKPAAAFTTPATPVEPVATVAPVEKPVKPTRPATAAVQGTTASMVVPVAQTQPVETTAVPTAEATQEPDPMIAKIARHLNRNIRYPEKARAGIAEGKVFFSVAVDQNGNFSNIQFYDEAPGQVFPLNKVITVSYFTKSMAREPLPAEDSKKIFEAEMKRVLEKKPDLSNCTPQAERYYFRAEFKLYEEQPKTV
jgi:N-acetylmuramoyl-L-alanine amidase